MKLSPQFASRKFSRGAYWICDPCYAMPEDFDIVGLAENAPGVAEVGDHRLFIWGTAFGDGIYPVCGPKMGAVGVDSGTLTIIPLDLVREWGAEEKLKEYEKRGIACSIRVARAFEVAEENGDVFFGEYCVDTTGFLDEDET